MLNNKEIAKKIADILTIIADKIKKNPEMLDKNNFDFFNLDNNNQNKEQNNIEIDIFSVYSISGESYLQQQLGELEIKELKKIIERHRFDTSKLSRKWQNKERLISLIIERVEARSEKGKVFATY